MSLTFSLNMAYRGLLATEAGLRTTSQNISNADRAGYTRKTYTSDFVTTPDGTAPIRGSVHGSLDLFLADAVIEDTSITASREIISQYIDLYVRDYGSTEGETTLNANINMLYSKLSTLSDSPEIGSDKSQVVSSADNIASILRDISSSIQESRARIDQEITDSTNAINSALQTIQDLNKQILELHNNPNAALAEYEDQRVVAIQNLAKEIDIQYFFDANNQAQIYTASGEPMLLATRRTLSHDPTTVVNGSIVYPAGFQPIILNGTDITTSVSGGRLGGLIELRDNYFVEEQSKLDEFADVLRNELNAVLNTGASIPPRSTITGTQIGFTAGTAFSGTGLVRFAVTDMNGIVVNTVDLDLSLYATVGALQTAINAIPNINATLTVDGELEITAANANEGVAMNQLTSSVAPSGRTFGHFFGLNDLFDGLTAEDIDITEYLRAGPEYLSAGRLNSGVLVAGDQAVQPGDGSVAEDMADIMQANVSFNAAGNFAAQSISIIKYVDAITANVSSRAKIAEDNFESAALVQRQTETIMNNKTGVNIDEETAILIELESKYQASARVIASIRDMFQALLDAVR